jgi:hypothetical protein
MSEYARLPRAYGCATSVPEREATSDPKVRQCTAQLRARLAEQPISVEDRMQTPRVSAIRLASIGASRAHHAVVVVSIAALCSTACVATHPLTAGARRDVLTASPRLLTERELAPFGTTRLDDALVRVRPELLRYHGRETLIYLDGFPASRSDLHALSANTVARVRLLSRLEAALEYGGIVGVEPILDVRTRRP